MAIFVCALVMILGHSPPFLCPCGVVEEYGAVPMHIFAHNSSIGFTDESWHGSSPRVGTNASYSLNLVRMQVSISDKSTLKHHIVPFVTSSAFSIPLLYASAPSACTFSISRVEMKHSSGSLCLSSPFHRTHIHASLHDRPLEGHKMLLERRSEADIPVLDASLSPILKLRGCTELHEVGIRCRTLAALSVT